MRRFYSPNIGPSVRETVLDREQTTHMRSVLRLRVGDVVSVFDGRGLEFSCEVLELEKKGARLKVRSETYPPAPESPLDLTLGAALLKKDKFDLVVQKAVELGVSALVPIITKRTDPFARKAEKRLERWSRIIVEASKQCGRAKLMELREPSELDSFLTSAEGLRIAFTERGGEPLPAVLQRGPVLALVGPEGGWEEEELELARERGFRLFTLGTRILRAETASITVAAILQNKCGDLR